MSVTSIKRNILKISAFLLVVMSFVMRVISIPETNRDMTVFNLRWYQTLYQNGIGEALATNFSNYAPPYTYLLALATLTHGLIPPLVAIKLIPICFDLLGAFFIYKIIKLKYPQNDVPILASAIYLAAPTVILNSAYWGQADSIYTSILLACLYFLLTEQSLAAMLAFGLAFSVKAQAVFLLPFLGVMVLRKKIHWVYFGLIPLVYLIAILPVVLLGRSLSDALLIYAKQSDTFNVLAMNAPNFYSLFPRGWYSTILPLGLIVTAVILARWTYVTGQSKIELDKKYIILIALISASLTPFLLPKMHDRYFYPADVLSIVLAFFWPGLWYIPILYQLASTGAISIFLFNGDSGFVVYGFLLNTIAIAVLLKAQRLVEIRDAINEKITSAFSWLVSALSPILLFGIFLNILLSPSWIRVEYALPHTASTLRELNKSERFELASTTISYLNNDRRSQYIERFTLKDGSLVYNKQETSILNKIKRNTQEIIMVWNFSLAFLYILGWLAWAEDWLPQFRHGVKRGGWATIILVPIVGVTIIASGFSPNLQNTDMLLYLFPPTLWRDSLLFMAAGLIGGGFLLTRIKTVE
jgi:Gpi18-like mannosyltransferase